MTVRRVGAALALAAAVAASFLMSAVPVRGAGPVTVEIDAPPELALGDEATIGIILLDGSGAPVARAPVILQGSGSFLSTDGAMRLGEATTDAQGRAGFAYQARIQGPVVLTVYFAGDSRLEPATASIEIAIRGSSQLYSEAAGVRVPGIGVWLLAGLLGGVWSTYFAVMAFLTLIARAPAEDSLGLGVTESHE